jgi:phospho-N-acetylmuramoyl-pentapeptide-transferase
MFYHLLYPLHEQFPLLNVFRYLSFRTVYATVTALGLALLLGGWVTDALRRFQIGQQIRKEGPKSHQSKAGTPTMGGILILGSILISTLLWANLANAYVWLVIFVTVGFGLIGFWDDLLKSVRKDSRGLLPRYKFGLQILVAAAASFALHALPAYSTVLSVPFFKMYRPDLGLLYALFALLVIVGSSNAVNLTDGLDGLAIGPIITSAMAYTLFAYLAGHRKFSDYLLIPHVEGAGELAIFCGAMVGAGLGFLWFNSHPASVFMGDVGSLPLGAALGMVAIVAKQELLLVIVGGVFVVEALSVVAQVVSYQSRGKRIFLMSPLHHHFELKGWPETKVVARFWIVSIVLALVSLSTLKLR